MIFGSTLQMMIELEYRILFLRTNFTPTKFNFINAANGPPQTGVSDVKIQLELAHTFYFRLNNAREFRLIGTAPPSVQLAKTRRMVSREKERKKEREREPVRGLK